jgi:hypothetical protein
MDLRQKTTTAQNTTWTYSPLKIVTKWKHRTHPSFCIYLQPESTALQLSESNEGESWRIGVFLKTESSHDKQGCTTVVASTEVQFWHRMDWRQKTTTAHNTTWTFSSLKIVTNWKHRTHPLFCIYLQPESTAPQLYESNEGESWCIGVFLKTKSLHDKQGCTTVIASTEVQFWHRMGWQQKTSTSHNTSWTFSSLKIVTNWEHRTHPSFCIYLQQRLRLETTLDGTKFRMRRIHNDLSMGGDRVIASTLCNPVRKNYVQIQVGTTVQCTSTNKWSQNRCDNCTGYNRMISKHVIHHTRST